MKKYLLQLFAVCFLTAAAAGFSVTSKVSPRTVLAGEAASFSVTCDGKGDMKFDLPEVKGINWIRRGVSTSQSYSSINGRTTRSVTRSVYFTVNEPGEYEIPALEVACGKEKSFTAPVRFTVLAPGSAPGKEENIPATAQVVWPDTGKFYTGQWIPLQIIMTVPDGMDVGRYSFPQLNGVENLIFYNFSGNQARRRDFGEVRQERAVHDGVNVTRIIFPAAVRAITAKVPDITGTVTLGIVRRDEERRNGYDSFFDSFFDRMNERIVPVNIKIAPAEKKPELLLLPDEPAGVYYLDLFGKAEINSTLSAQKCAAGEAVELILIVSSDDISRLKAPEIKVDNFRVYKPEVKYFGKTAEIRYCMIPLSPGRGSIDIKFASFDTKSGKYLISEVRKTLEITPSKAVVTSETPEQIKTEHVENKKIEESVKTPSLRTEPLYIKTSEFRKIHLDLWRNSMWFYLTGFVFMPIAAAVVYLIRRHRRSLEMNPEIQLKRSLVKYARAILNKTDKTVLSDFEKSNIISAVAGVLGMEQGTSASEIAEKISDDELKAWFRKIDENSFNFSAKTDTILTGSVRKKLLKLIKCAVILFCIALPSLYAQSAEQLFNSGKYLEAAAVYRSQLDVRHPSPELLYNIGTCYLNAGKFPAARAALAAAHKLAPRDEEITENLNLVNRKLVQNEVNRTDTPVQLFKYCRDRLRPDEHLAMAAVIFGIAMLVFALNPAKWKMISGISGIVIAIFIYLMTSQLYDSYQPHQAVTLPDFLELKQLPSDTPSQTVATIPGGSDAKVLQIRGNWMELEVNGKTGWVKSDTVAFTTH